MNSDNQYPADLVYQLEQLLQQQGEYSARELLILQGRLNYSDYTAWCKGDIDYLEDSLFGNPALIAEQLQQAETYLLNRGGWVAVQKPEIQPGTRVPHFSKDPVLNECFRRCYQKDQNQLQTDLFTDGTATQLTHGVTVALANHDFVKARELLERLYDHAPDHVHLGGLERLVEAAETLNRPVRDIASELALLQRETASLAVSLLGHQHRNLVIPLWQRLSLALADACYQPDQAELHLSYTASQALDWQVARQAVEREPHWREDAVLLERHAIACEHLRQPTDAMLSWFHLLWRFPNLGDNLSKSTAVELRQHWTHFKDLDPELAVEAFPAWLILQQPGLTKLLPPLGAIPHPAAESYQTVYQMQTANTTAKQINLRAQLKQQDAVLFQYYLDKIRSLKPKRVSK